jgi:thiamine-phosphate pyrophosphorylase
VRPGFVLGITAGGPDLLSRVRVALDAGVDAVLLREDALPAGLPVGPRVFVHARIPDAVGIARAHGHGLHLPDGVDVAAIRGSFAGPLSCSRHSPDAAREALDAGADLVLLSPIWPPGSKPDDARPTLGLDAIRAVRGLPVLALGGVTAARVAYVAEAGARGVAAIGAIFGRTADPAAFVTAVRSAYSAVSDDQA